MKQWIASPVARNDVIAKHHPREASWIPAGVISKGGRTHILKILIMLHKFQFFVILYI